MSGIENTAVREEHRLLQRFAQVVGGIARQLVDGVAQELRKRLLLVERVLDGDTDRILQVPVEVVG